MNKLFFTNLHKHKWQNLIKHSLDEKMWIKRRNESDYRQVKAWPFRQGQRWRAVAFLWRPVLKHPLTVCFYPTQSCGPQRPYAGENGRANTSTSAIRKYTPTPKPGGRLCQNPQPPQPRALRLGSINFSHLDHWSVPGAGAAGSTRNPKQNQHQPNVVLKTESVWSTVPFISYYSIYSNPLSRDTTKEIQAKCCFGSLM